MWYSNSEKYDHPTSRTRRLYLPKRIARPLAALVEGQDDPDLETMPASQGDDVKKPPPIINPRRLPLHDPPPDLHHDPLHARRRQRRERRPQHLRPAHGAVGADGVLGERDEDGGGAGGSGRRRGERMVLEELRVLVPGAGVVRGGGRAAAGGDGDAGAAVGVGVVVEERGEEGSAAEGDGCGCGGDSHRRTAETAAEMKADSDLRSWRRRSREEETISTVSFGILVCIMGLVSDRYLSLALVKYHWRISEIMNVISLPSCFFQAFFPPRMDEGQ